MLDTSKTPITADQPAFGCFVRLFWMAIGNVALIFAGISVSTSERVGWADAVYGALTLVLLLARWIDITKLQGMTIRTQRATRAHLRNYAVCLLGIALIGWAVARWVSTLHG